MHTIGGSKTSDPVHPRIDKLPNIYETNYFVVLVILPLVFNYSLSSRRWDRGRQVPGVTTLVRGLKMAILLSKS